MLISSFQLWQNLQQLGLRHHPFDTLSLKVVEFRPLNLGDRSFGHFAEQPTHLAINLILS
jgi:hypothetical protein